MVDDVEVGKKRVASMRFETYVMVLRTKDARVVFLAMVKTFPINGDNWINGKMGRVFSNWVGRNVKMKKKVIKMCTSV